MKRSVFVVLTIVAAGASGGVFRHHQPEPARRPPRHRRWAERGRPRNRCPASSGSLADSCVNFHWNVTQFTGTSGSGTFSATCFGNLDVVGIRERHVDGQRRELVGERDGHRARCAAVRDRPHGHGDARSEQPDPDSLFRHDVPRSGERDGNRGEMRKGPKVQGSKGPKGPLTVRAGPFGPLDPWTLGPFPIGVRPRSSLRRSCTTLTRS